MIPSGEIHLWSASWEDQISHTSFWGSFLVPEEKKKAARFLLERHRARFQICRGMLRKILSEYTGVAPSEIPLEYGFYGKPFLKGLNLTFNLSHSEGRVVYAFGQSIELGIDLECIRPLKEAYAMANRFFHPKEQEEFFKEAKEEIFFKIWTRKEAILKALGTGFYACVEHFHDLWHTEELHIAENVIATLAYLGNKHKLIYRNF